MSYILEALRKAERERQLGETPTIAEVLSIQPVKRRNWWPWLVAVLLSLNGGVLGYFWITGWGHGKLSAPVPTTKPLVNPVQGNATEAEKQANVIASNEKPAPPSATSLVQAGDAHVPPASRLITPTAKVSAKPISPQAKAPPVVREIMPLEASKSERPDKSLSTEQAIRNPMKSPPFDKAFGRVDNQDPFPASDRFPAARLDKPKDGDTEQGEGVPSLDEMPDEIQQRMPNIKINVLAYSTVPEERFAVINMVKYNKGEQIPGGAILRDIQANGLVLELNGKQFRVSHR